MSVDTHAHTTADLERLLFDLVRRERFARDTADWRGLADAYWPGAVVRVTWFEGTAEEFIRISQDQQALGRGKSIHPLIPLRVKTHGDRALIESRGQIMIRPRIHGVECDVTSWCRFFSKAEQRGGQWRLLSFDSIYGKDRLDPVIAGTRLGLDLEALESYRPSYRHLTYLNRQAGYEVPDDLPGDDRQELVDAFYAEAETWLVTQVAPAPDPSHRGVVR